MPRRKQPVISDTLLDQLLDGADAKSAFDPNGMLQILLYLQTEALRTNSREVVELGDGQPGLTETDRSSSWACPSEGHAEEGARRTHAERGDGPAPGW
jgi:hypothetical protein